MDKINAYELRIDKQKNNEPQIHDYSSVDYITKSLTTKKIILESVDLCQVVQSLRNDIIKNKTRLVQLDERIIALEGNYICNANNMR